MKPRLGRGWPRKWLQALGFLGSSSALVWAPGAWAHGGIPRAQGVFFEPENPATIVLRSDVWGFFKSIDGGETWSWSCAEVYGGRSTSTEKRSLVVLPGGEILVAAYFRGLQRGSADGCTWAHVDDLADSVVVDVLRDPTDGSVWAVTSTGADGGVTTRLWRSTDAGQTFTDLETAIDGFSATNLLIAPTDGSRLYIAGKELGSAGEGRVLTSTDRGETWQTHALPPASSDDWSPRLIAVDPSDPGRVFVWEDTSEVTGQVAQADSILLSTDAAATWTRVYEGAGDLPGFEYSPDGARIAFGGPEDGLFIVDAADFDQREQIADGAIWGIAWNEEGLFAGWNQYPGESRAGATFAVSRNDGVTFEPLMSLCDVKPLACIVGTMYEQICTVRYTESLGFREDFQSPSACSTAVEPMPGSGGSSGGSMGPDGGADEPSNQASTLDVDNEGCSVAALPASPGRAFPWWLLALAPLLARRGQPRGGSRPD